MTVSTIFCFGLAVDGVRSSYGRCVKNIPDAVAKISVGLSRFVENDYILDQLIFSYFTAFEVLLAKDPVRVARLFAQLALGLYFMIEVPFGFSSSLGPSGFYSFPRFAFADVTSVDVNKNGLRAALSSTLQNVRFGFCALVGTSDIPIFANFWGIVLSLVSLSFERLIWLRYAPASHSGEFTLHSLEAPLEFFSCEGLVTADVVTAMPSKVVPGALLLVRLPPLNTKARCYEALQADMWAPWEVTWDDDLRAIIVPTLTFVEAVAWGAFVPPAVTVAESDNRHGSRSRQQRFQTEREGLIGSPGGIISGEAHDAAAAVSEADS
jgi:hypothetical protein